MSSKDDEEAAKKELLPAPKKAKSARFEVSGVGVGDDKKKGEEDGEETYNMTHQGTHQGSHQFTQYAKSFRHYLTRDVLPSEHNYRNLLSFRNNAAKRPTMQELREEEIMMKNKENADKRKEEDCEGGQTKGKVIKFGWIEGVYMRCLLNIWGVMLFLRLTWVIGQCGIWEGLLVITLCNIVTLVTTFSMSAVATNGQISGGGVYFMISRSLGPEFGGAIGLMFTLANSIAVAMYTIGFAESLLDMCEAYIPGWTGIVDHDFTVFRTNDVRIIGCGTIVLILVLAMVGMDWVTRVQKLLLVLLMCSQLDFVIGSFTPKSEEIYAKGFTGWNVGTAERNFNSGYTEGQGFFSVFAVFFPAVTGIVAGANLSGDLKDPGVAIPKGTLLAIASTYVTYIFYGCVVGFTFEREASGNVTEYQMWTNGSISEDDRTLPSYLDCTLASRRGVSCEFGTLNDQQTMSLISVTGYLIYGGCFAATLSSAIASLVGAPRVLQALAKDKLYPKIDFFAPGWGANNDPVRGYILVFIIAVGCILIAELNIVSSLLSNFFVAAYALINFSVFHASITKSPGWRPSFKYYSPWLSLAGVFLCLFAMFAMDWITALVTFLITAVLYLYIFYRKPEANWGSSAQAQVFVNALKSVQNLTETQEHVKNYRPKILVLTGNPAHRPPLVDFANLMTKKLSLLICGHVITEPGSVHLAPLKESTQAWMTEKKIKGFYTVTENNSFEEGGKSCLNLAGLGKLSPNMLLMGFKSNWSSDLDLATQYFNILESAFDHAYSVGILRVKSGLDFSGHIQAVETEAEHNEAESKASTPETGDDEDHSSSTDSKDTEEAHDVVPDLTPVAPVNQRTRTRTISRSVYTDSQGNPVSQDVIQDINQFQGGKRDGTIDVWWLYDDGGLTLLLPYILTTRQQFSGCQLRVFTLANRKEELDRETRNMAALLAKFRIEFSSVIVIPDVTKRAGDDVRTAFNNMIESLPEGTVTEEELLENKEKSNRHMRLSELLQEHSKEAEMIFLTLTLPRKGQVSAPLYLAWLDIMTRDLPPTLLIRGNQTSVLTFYS